MLAVDFSVFFIDLTVIEICQVQQDVVAFEYPEEYSWFKYV